MFNLDKFIDDSFEAGEKDNDDCDIVIEAWCERVKFWEDLDRLFYKKSYLIYFSYQGHRASWVCFSKRDLRAHVLKLIARDKDGDLDIKWREVYAIGDRTKEDAAAIVCKVRSIYAN